MIPASIRPPTRPVWAELSASALCHNYAALRAEAARADAEIIAVIKADAYGHGAAGAQQALRSAGCGWFAVTSLEEAAALPPLAPGMRMLLLSGLYANEAAEVVARGLTPVISSTEQLEWLAAAAAVQPRPFCFHIEIDTGMARQGFLWDDPETLTALAASIAKHRSVTLEGVMTHFASPEDAASPQTTQQIDRFHSALAHLRTRGCQAPLLHAGNSASLGNPTQATALRALARQFDSRLLMRPGIALYGYGAHATGQALTPVLSWKTRITALRTIAAGESVSYNATFRAARPMRIALLPVGYADGYNRLLSNRGAVLVRGQRAPIAGRVTMDQIMVDVNDIPEAALDDEVVLLGTQGSARISAEHLATLTGTISYEVLCAIGPRVHRLWQQR
jgi:alanine racemase